MNKPAKSVRLPAGLESRMLAMRLLHRVLDKERTVEQAWENELEVIRGMEPADAGFARVLLLGTLRHLGQIDSLLAQLIETPLPDKAGVVHDALRVAVAQLVWLEVPHHAAVHSTVEVIRALRQPAYCGLANAVLQRLLREWDQWNAFLENAVEKNVPLWLRARLTQAYGAEGLRGMLQAQMEFGSSKPVCTDIRLKPGVDAQALLGALPPEAALLPNGSLRLVETGRIERLSGYEEGQWWVQDAAASMPAEWLLALVGSGKKRVLDMCAAPGGKTAQLAAAGHTTTAVDLSAARLQRLQENMARLKLSVAVQAADAATYQAAHKFDGALLDAPCSATGTIRRHPELPWQRTAADVARLVELQARLLDQAEHWIAPGGVLIYAVCSLLPEEGEEQIAALLTRSKAWAHEVVSDAQLASFGLSAAQRTNDGAIRVVPSDWAELGGMDGFFIAALRRL
jgi:16S rRNA (cytosine967-C5)-methyltransferase